MRAICMRCHTMPMPMPMALGPARVLCNRRYEKAQKPLAAFEADIMRYADLTEEIAAENAGELVRFLAVDCGPLKQVLDLHQKPAHACTCFCQPALRLIGLWCADADQPLRGVVVQIFRTAAYQGRARAGRPACPLPAQHHSSEACACGPGTGSGCLLLWCLVRSCMLSSICCVQLSEDMALHKSLAAELPGMAACFEPLRNKYRALAKFEVRAAAECIMHLPALVDAAAKPDICHGLAGACSRRRGSAA